MKHLTAIILLVVVTCYALSGLKQHVNPVQEARTNYQTVKYEVVR